MVSALLDKPAVEPTIAGTDEPPQTFTGHNLVFIVGCSRSGTTWLQRLLASHPSVHTGQESFLFHSYIAPQLRAWRKELDREAQAASATGRGGIGLSCYFEESEFLAILRDYLNGLLEPMVGSLQPGEIFVEKTPQHALALPEIRALLPESRIIHIVRDPRDVVASLLAAARGWGAGWAPRAPHRAARMWSRHVLAVREAARGIAPSQFHELSYEQLSADPLATLRPLARFLCLEWTDDEIRAAIAANRAETVQSGGGTPLRLSGEVARRVGDVVRDPAEFIRRGRPGGWRADLSLWQRLLVWYIARDTMAQVGYSARLKDSIW